jgi:hypothetical protein
MVVDLIVQPERLARIVDQHRRDQDQPGVDEVLSTLTERVFGEAPADLRHAELQRVVQAVVVGRMIEVARSEAAPPRVRYRLDAHLDRLRERLDDRGGDEASQAFRTGLRDSIARYRNRTEPGSPLSVATPPAPPGQPIGTQPWSLSEASGCSWSDPSN